MTLTTILNDPAAKAQVVSDCVELIDRQVATKGGLGGMALKATYGVIKGIGASYIPGAVERLLPEMLTSLDPLWAEGMGGGDPVAYLSQRPTEVADTILGVTDRRVTKTTNGLVKSSYGKLRQSIKGDVEAAVPGLAKILGAQAAAVR